jgi:hypothetical protein
VEGEPDFVEMRAKTLPQRKCIRGELGNFISREEEQMVNTTPETASFENGRPILQDLSPLSQPDAVGSGYVGLHASCPKPPSIARDEADNEINTGRNQGPDKGDDALRTNHEAVLRNNINVFEQAFGAHKNAVGKNQNAFSGNNFLYPIPSSELPSPQPLPASVQEQLAILEQLESGVARPSNIAQCLAELVKPKPVKPQPMSSTAAPLPLLPEVPGDGPLSHRIGNNQAIEPAAAKGRLRLLNPFALFGIMKKAKDILLRSNKAQTDPDTPPHAQAAIPEPRPLSSVLVTGESKGLAQQTRSPPIWEAHLRAGAEIVRPGELIKR